MSTTSSSYRWVSQREHQGSVSQLIESTASRAVVSASTVRTSAVVAHQVSVLLGVCCRLLLDLDVVVVDEVPDRADVAAAVIADDGLRDVAICVRRVLDVVAQVVLRGVLSAPEDAVVIVGEKVRALIVRRLCDCAKQGDVEHGVALVPAALGARSLVPMEGRHRSVHLLDLSSSVVIEDPDRLVNGTIAGTIVEVVTGLVEHRLIVREDTC